MPDNIKFCIDCKQHNSVTYEGNKKLNTGEVTTHFCRYHTDPVTGEGYATTCYNERTRVDLVTGGNCGPDAKFFEPKEVVDEQN